MEVRKDKVVTIEYTLKNESGEVLDTSEGGSALSYIHGNGFLVPGVEKALEGKGSGDRVEITVPPEDGYGTHDQALVMNLDRSAFNEFPDLQEGTRFQADTDKGPRMFSVVEVGPEQVVVDGNHPLADMTLSFDITVREIREATAEELEHGHVHE